MELEPVLRDYDAATNAGIFSDAQILAGIPEILSSCNQCHVGKDLESSQLPKIEILYNRPIASSGFNGYSEQLKRYRGEIWNKNNLLEFLADPEKFAQGTTMKQFSIRDEKQRLALLDYLESQ